MKTSCRTNKPDNSDVRKDTTFQTNKIKRNPEHGRIQTTDRDAVCKGTVQSYTHRPRRKECKLINTDQKRERKTATPRLSKQEGEEDLKPDPLLDSIQDN